MVKILYEGITSGLHGILLKGLLGFIRRVLTLADVPSSWLLLSARQCEVTPSPNNAHPPTLHD